MPFNPEFGESLRKRANDRWLETKRDLDEAMIEIERLQTLVGQHDPTGADHMAEMWVHAQRADAAEAEVERLQRRCEVYAAGIAAIAAYKGDLGLGYQIPQRMAETTLTRIQRLDQEG